MKVCICIISKINSRRTHMTWRNFQPSTRERHDGLGSGPIAIRILLRTTNAPRQIVSKPQPIWAFRLLLRVHAVTYHHNQEGANPTLTFFL